MKELTVRHFGTFFGNEPLRGGRARGDWRAAMDALGAGVTSPLPGTRIVDWDDLSSKADVDALFASLPHEGTKTLIRIAG